MTPERHQQIQEIFEAALDLPTSRRTAFLDEVCGADSELRSRVERLIGATEEESNVSGSEEQTTTLVRECPTCARCFEGTTLTCSFDGTALQPGFPGSLLIDGKYLIERHLGRGGMGSVYLVKHLALDKRFALKMISADGPIPKWSLKSFETEARALGRLKHRNIVDVTDYGVDANAGGLAYLVMEYLEGKTWSQILKDQHAVPFPQAVVHLRAVALAVDAAHAENIVHGDLKPSNLFLATQRNSPDVIKVVDFGLARLAASAEWTAPPGAGLAPDQSTVGGNVRGTPGYMAPELFRAQRATPASDRYAFGVLIYETLTGHSPFGRHAWEVVNNLRSQPAPPSARNSQLPEELDAPLLALLNPIPEERPVSASAAVSEMDRGWLAAEQRKWREREVERRFVLAVVATILVVFLAGFAARLDILQSLENRAVDARFALLPKHPPDPRLLVISLDEATLAQDRPPLADRAWADEFGQTLERIFTVGARAVGVDLLLPLNWSSSSEFARLIARRADQLALALFSAPSGEVVGTEGVGPLSAHLLGPERYRSLFGFVNLKEDEDRAIRRASFAYLDRAGQHRASFASRATTVASLHSGRDDSTDSQIWIDYSVSPRAIPKISWKDVQARLNVSPELFRGKLVMVGADYAGSNDEHRVPATGSSGLLSGILLQALIVNTIAEGAPIRDVSPALCLLMAAILCFAAIGLTLRFPHRSLTIVLSAAAACCGYALLAFAMFRSSRIMIAVIGPELAILLSIVVAWCLKTYLSPYPTAERLVVSGG